MNDDINSKASILKNSKLFTNYCDSGYLADKQCILLALTGQKPISEATSAKKIETANGWHTTPEDHDKIKGLMSQLGLHYLIEDGDSFTNVAVSLDANLLDQYANSSDRGSINGDLFGYPKTAIAVFGNNDLLMNVDEQDALMESAGLPLYMPNFRFSKLHFKEEIEVLKGWFDTLKKYDFTE